MRTLRININDWPQHLLRLGPRFKQAAMRGALRGALRGVATLQRASAGVTNTGQYRRAWKAARLADGAKVYNVAPYATVIEHGRKPGSRQPPAVALARWAQRKLGVSPERAQRVGFALAKAIKRRGLPPRRVLDHSWPEVQRGFMEEMRKELDRELEQP